MLVLSDRLRERIRSGGPITFHDWMKAALYDPWEGYYCRPERERWGSAGDYRTSSERSILFGATFARYYAKLYAALGSPVAWTIVEVGAGAGHFAEAVLETFHDRFPQVFSATRYIIDEISAASRSRAGQRLARFKDQVKFQRLAEVDPVRPGIIFSNELLDAFPVHRVIMRESELHEFYVCADESGNFAWTIRKPSTERLAEYFAQLGIRLGEGQVAEVNLGLEGWLREVSEKLAAGYLIAVDYGAEAFDLYATPDRRKGTLRGFNRHQFAEDLLSSPGEQDLTSSVDWTLVKLLSARCGFKVVEFEGQDRFLLRAGLLEELELRVNKAEHECEKLRLRTNAREMALPSGMAASFQVLVQKKPVDSQGS